MPSRAHTSGGNRCTTVPVSRKPPRLLSHYNGFPVSHYKHMCGCVYMSTCTHTWRVHTPTCTGCPRGLCDMLYLIFIPSLQSASPQGAPVSLSPPPAPAVLSVFHIPQNEQLPRSSLLLGGVLEGCWPPDLTQVPIPGQPLGDQGKGTQPIAGLLWLLGS